MPPPTEASPRSNSLASDSSLDLSCKKMLDSLPTEGAGERRGATAEAAVLNELLECEGPGAGGVSGPLEFVSVLGKGASSVVWLARDAAGAELAVKVLKLSHLNVPRDKLKLHIGTLALPNLALVSTYQSPTPTNPSLAPSLPPACAVQAGDLGDRCLRWNSVLFGFLACNRVLCDCVCDWRPAKLPKMVPCISARCAVGRDRCILEYVDEGLTPNDSETPMFVVFGRGVAPPCCRNMTLSTAQCGKN